MVISLLTHWYPLIWIIIRVWKRFATTIRHSQLFEIIIIKKNKKEKESLFPPSCEEVMIFIPRLLYHHDIPSFSASLFLLYKTAWCVLEMCLFWYINSLLQAYASKKLYSCFGRDWVMMIPASELLPLLKTQVITEAVVTIKRTLVQNSNWKSPTASTYWHASPV